MLITRETRIGMKVTGKCNNDTKYGINIGFVFSIVKSFIELLRYILRIPGVKFFLSERLSQDPLENFFGCQRQRCRTNENPNLHKLCKNTQALRVINSVCGTVSKGNCRGNKQVTYMDEITSHCLNIEESKNKKANYHHMQ